MIKLANNAIHKKVPVNVIKYLNLRNERYDVPFKLYAKLKCASIQGHMYM